MNHRLRRIEIFLLILLALMYIGAKIHFFDRYNAEHPGAYVAEHWLFWVGMCTIGLVLAILEGIRWFGNQGQTE